MGRQTLAHRDALARKDAKIDELREALCWGVSAALNELQARGLPLEWSPSGGIGKMLAALNVNATTMTPEVWGVVQGKILRRKLSIR